MLSNQFLEQAPQRSLRVLGGVVLCAALAAGCASGNRADTNVSAPTRAEAEAVAPEPELTATEAAIAGAGSASTSSSASQGGVTSESIRPDAPSRYTVKRGDTLWDISNMFLRDPWLWPEIWIVNPQVENPHLIFPGDVLALAYGADGRPQIILEQGSAARLSPRLRSTPIDGPIATIPYGAIAAFLSRPSLLSAEEVKTAPRVLAFREDHMIGGTGHEVYVRNLAGDANARYAVVHVGDKLHDPDSGDVLGYEGVYTATARVTTPGEPSKAMLSDAARETLEGDRLIASTGDLPLSFDVRVPQADVNGQIISVVDDTALIGPYQIIAINRGTRHGLEPGHVLAIDQAGAVVRDHNAREGSWLNFGSSFSPKVTLPDERAGTLLVFKTYDRMSYAIIVGAQNAMRVADKVRTP